MRHILLLSILLHSLTATATQALIPGLKEQNKRYHFGSCKCWVNWLEVQAYNKTATDSINSTIRHELQAFEWFPDSAACCSSWQHKGFVEKAYEVKQRNPRMLSFLYTKIDSHPGKNIPGADFLTLNFNAQTGRRLRISQAIYAQKKASFDSIILQRLAMVHNCPAGTVPEWLTSQLAEPAFIVEGDGITLLFANKDGWYDKQPWTFSELRRYMQTEMFGDLLF